MKVSLLAFLSFFLLSLQAGSAYSQNYTKKQIESFRQEAEHGDADAQTRLGMAYANGWGVSIDLSVAAQWISKAAKQGHAVAQSYLGWMYATGKGVKKNSEESLFWYRKAAEQGDKGAQYNLGRRYVTGDGVEKDYAEAFSWLSKAAEQDYSYALYDLGVMYELGEGVEQSEKKARELFQKAANQGIEEAKRALLVMDIESKANQYASQQMRDVYSIAKLLEEYKEKTGHYPFYDSSPAEEGYIKVGVLAVLASPTAEAELIKKPNPFNISSGRALLSDLKAELKNSLGREVDLPVDPQEAALYAPNAYYAYFSTDDEYIVLAFLYNPNDYTSELFNPHANVYAISSSNNIRGFCAGIQPRLFSEVSADKP